MSKLAGKVEAAPNKSLGFDTDTKLNYDTAKSFYNEGYRFAIRYVSLGSEAPGDLTHEEANAILELTFHGIFWKRNKLCNNTH